MPFFLDSTASPKPYPIQAPRAGKPPQVSKIYTLLPFPSSTSLLRFSFLHLWALLVMLSIHPHHKPFHPSTLSACRHWLHAGPRASSALFALTFKHFQALLPPSPSSSISPSIAPSWVCSCGPNCQRLDSRLCPTFLFSPTFHLAPSGSQLPFRLAYTHFVHRQWSSHGLNWYLPLLLSEDKIATEMLSIKT